MTTNGLKPKIPPRRVASDACTVNVGRTVVDGKIDNPGIDYPVHKGEYVEIIPAVTVAEVLAFATMQRLSISRDERDAAAVEQIFRDLCEQLSHRIMGWTWTDMMGQPLPNPHGRPEVLMRLSNDELVWLVNAASGQETAEERAKGSGPLPSTSSATAAAAQVLSPLKVY